MSAPDFTHSDRVANITVMDGRIVTKLFYVGNLKDGRYELIIGDLQQNEQYRLQMASITTASLGYWKEGDTIHPDYDTVPLRDVAKLYAKYDALFQAASEFCNRVEKGEVKSRKTYHKFKMLVDPIYRTNNGG